MKLATTLRLSLAALALGAWAGAASAQLTAEPVGTFFGYTLHNHLTNTTQVQPAAPAALPLVVYDNMTAAVQGGFSSTDLGAVWGDQVATTGTGTLEEAACTIYNSSSSAGPVLTAVFSLDYYDAVSFAYLGGFVSNVNFGSGLPPGYYSDVTFTGLDPLAIDLNVTDVIVLQSVSSFTGTATRLGIVLKDPPAVGSSGPEFYADASTVGTAGWYTLTGINANPGYQISVVSGPVPTEKSSWGRLKDLYR